MSRSPPRHTDRPCALCPLASGATAQIIPIKTVPVAQADQFDVFPSGTSQWGASRSPSKTRGSTHSSTPPRGRDSTADSWPAHP